MFEWVDHINHWLSVPIYALIIPVEILLSHFNHWHFYSWKETAVNVYLNLFAAGLDLLMRGFAFGVLVFFAKYSFPVHLHPILYWAALFLCEDVLFWMEHYVDHHVRLFWAVHVTHHSSAEYNLTTGFRSSVLMPFYRYLYFIPLALLGFAPLDIFLMYAITQTYGILVHTQSIGKLPRWIEYIFVTPSHHRVHHASNIPYLDKNMGMCLIIWDRLFGTFTEEMQDEPPVFGLMTPIEDPHHPIKIVTHEWQAIGKDLARKTSFLNKLHYLFRAPGWSHDGSSVTSEALQQRYWIEKALSKQQKENKAAKKREPVAL